MERNIQKIGALNFVILLITGAISLILARYTNSIAGQVASVFFGIGFLAGLVSFFQMGLEEKERLEKLEYDEISREKNAASLFSTEAETFPARRSREQFERFFLPGFTIFLFLAEAAAAVHALGGGLLAGHPVRALIRDEGAKSPQMLFIDASREEALHGVGRESDHRAAGSRAARGQHHPLADCRSATP